MDRNDTVQVIIIIMYTSLSARRAWIEIPALLSNNQNSGTSLSARRAWIEIYNFARQVCLTCRSLSARRAWIEIAMTGQISVSTVVVALRKESVDRNLVVALLAVGRAGSLSARRAWIEILYQLYDTYAKVVALRKESVDRNLTFSYRLM